MNHGSFLGNAKWERGKEISPLAFRLSPFSMNKLKQKLINFGLFEKEAEAYLRLLSKGEATVEELADQSVEYGDILTALDSLADKQLIKKIQAMSKIYFKAEDPEKVLQNLKIKRTQAEVSKDKIDRAMLNLNWIYNQQERCSLIKTYQGYEGVLEVRKKIFSQTHDCIYNLTSLHKHLPNHHIGSMLEQVKANFYLIIPKSDEHYLEKINNAILNRAKLKIKVIDNKFWQQKSEILIFGETVAFGNIEDEQFFTVIEDEVVSQTMIKAFLTLWSHTRGSTSLH